MAGSSNQFTYNLGATSIAVPVGNTGIAVIPPAHCIGVFLRYNTGGTLAITNQLAAGATTGMYVSAVDTISIDGPAQFFLNATGATAVAGIAWKLSSGISFLP